MLVDATFRSVDGGETDPSSCRPHTAEHIVRVPRVETLRIANRFHQCIARPKRKAGACDVI